MINYYNKLIFKLCKTRIILIVSLCVFGDFAYSKIPTDDIGTTAAATLPAAPAFLAGECIPISTLPCSSLVVSLPYSLAFTSSVSGTIADKNGAGTGFTTVNTYSGTRIAADGSPSNSLVPGYEVSKITVTGGRLTILSNKGIDSKTVNNLINVLGVKTAAVNKLQLEVKVINPFNGSDSQQGGLWYGLNDKNFLKLVVSGNKVEMRKETNDESSSVSGTSNPDQRITATINNLNTQTVRLRMIVDAAANTVEGFYSIDGINYINVGAAYSTKTLNISTMGITGGVSNAGLFATYRNGTTPITYTFDDFVLTDLSPATPSFQTVNINFRPSGTAAPAGYTADNGLPFDATRKFGWVNPVTKVPVNISANMRLRTGSGDARQLSMALMQVTSSSPVAGTWEYALPNGRYRVTLSAGDNNYYDSNHQINVEGLPAISDFIPTAQNKFRVGTATVQITDGRLTIDATGGNNDKINYLTISSASTITDAAAPTASARFVGTLQSANNYTNQVQIFLTAADAVSGLSSFQYSINNGAYVNYNATFSITTVGTYSLRVKAIDGNNNQITTNAYNFTVTKPGGATMTLKNMDNFPANDQLVFSYINTPWRRTTPVVTPYNANHDRVKLRIMSTGTGSLTVSGLTLSNSLIWKIVSINNDATAALPIQINPGAYAEVTIQFMARNLTPRIQIFADALTIISNDNATPSKRVTLRGLWQKKGEGVNEPYAQEIIDAFGFTSDVGYVSDDGSIEGKTILPNSSEINAGYFVRADNSKPVTVYQMAAYHGCCATIDSIHYYAKGSSTLRKIFAHNPLDGQSLLPRLDGTASTAQGTFTPTGAFGFEVGTSYSDRTRNFGGLIGLRFLKVYDSNGVLVPNAYFMNVDYLGMPFTNYDYQDGIYYIENIKPETVAARLAADELAVTIEDNIEIAPRNISVYPNPGTGSNINLNASNFGKNEKITISISSVTSDRILHTQTLITDLSGNANLPIPIKTALGRGIYIINASSESGVIRSKLLIE